ncbi:cytochrome P450 [Actinomadura rubrisoli]|uniref:Cytochrome P450 n=1 Tax=Actinomadura rubrisoli TaxID=2530368 RepID=A0A4R5BZH2_9ACTN|nr:cytochrome P450 [Actinomadura rubrisoli]TDD89854.1 cytochrome P450 [Actinomadura rubrisoli]
MTDTGTDTDTADTDTAEADAADAGQCPAFPFAFRPGVDPAPEYARLRAERPIIRVRLPSGHRAWLVTRHMDARRVFTDQRLSRAAACNAEGDDFAGINPPAGSLFALDPPEHTALRALVNKTFTARRVEDLKPQITLVAERLVARLVEQGPPADLVGGFAQPLSMTVLCRLLGVPESDHATFIAWSHALLSTAGTGGEVADARGRLGRYVAQFIETRRREPTDDLVSALVAAVDREAAAPHQAILLVMAILVGGHDSMANQLAGTAYLLLTHPDLAARLRAEPELVPEAAEEFLRYTSLIAVGGFPRVALEDVRLGDVLIKAGDTVIAAVDSANRDGSVFPHPDELHVERRPRGHLAFGHGTHRCLGAQLARAELGIAITTLIGALPDMRPACPAGELEWERDSLGRGLRSLPVTW